MCDKASEAEGNHANSEFFIDGRVTTPPNDPNPETKRFDSVCKGFVESLVADLSRVGRSHGVYSIDVSST